MQRTITLMMLALATTNACGPSPEEVRKADLAAQAAVVIPGEREAQAGLKSVRYPQCPTPFQDKQVTACGRSVLSAAISECKRRAAAWEGGRSSVIDQYAGDSWQQTAGRLAIATDGQRATQLEGEELSAAPFQAVALAAGDGTATVAMYACELGADLKLSGVNQLSRRPVR